MMEFVRYQRGNCWWLMNGKKREQKGRGENKRVCESEQGEVVNVWLKVNIRSGILFEMREKDE